MESNIEMESSNLNVEPIFYNNSCQEFRPDNCLFPFIQIKKEELQHRQVLLDSSAKPVNLHININQNDADQANYINTTILNETSVEHKTGKIENTEEENVTKIKKSTQNIQTYVHISDRIVTPRAIAVLPPALQLRRNVITPRRLLPPRVRFGPIQGVKHNLCNLKAKQLILTAATNKTPIFLLKMDDSCATHIDVSDKDKSNWFSLLQLGNVDTANVWIYEENNELYGITTECITPRKPLMLGYSKAYAETNNLPEGQPVLDLTKCSVETNSWWCYECRRPMASAFSLQRHINVYHKDDFISTRRRYRCRLCTRTFSRLYTLKRHMSRYCTKKSENSDKKIISTEAIPCVSLNTSHSTEDNRIPSDESFQNYSNSLDFSTNLFDDRMPGFDMASNSRSECDFSMYDTAEREGNVLATDLGLTAKLDYSQTNQTDKQQNSVEQLQVMSSDSRQTTTKEAKSQLLSLSPKRKLGLECSRTFIKKEALEELVKSFHINDIVSKQFKIPSDSTYKCEKCQLIFKRRGMLVNHLWRVHETKSVSVPLEKRVRHYPCVACTKIYRTAAKRDKHVRVHHPGAETVLARSIEAGTRACAPAACAACPRQYATRAKMLQHVRQHHPHLAPPVLRGSLKLKP